MPKDQKIASKDTKKRTRFPKGKKGMSTQDRETYKDMDKPYRKGPNDINWRTNDATMTKLVASLPFGNPAGLKMSHYVSAGGTTVTYTQPGLMIVGVDITAGSAINYNSPINLVGRKIYSYVRHANSGSKNYEAADMVNYFLAIGQVLGMLGYMQRILRTLSAFSNTNRYTPKALVEGMGIDYDDFISNIPNLKYLISWTGKAIGSLAFPDLPYFRACYETFQFIFVDNDSPKEQYYMLVPHVIGKYIPTYDANGGGVSLDVSTLTPAITPGGALNFITLEGIVRDRLDVLLGDEDCGIISGDILKAFKDAGLYTPAALDLEYELFKHSPEMLQQIHNLTVIDPTRLAFKGYHQDPGTANTAPFIKHDIVISSSWPRKEELCSALVIDAFSREPDPLEVVNCTVLQPQIFLKSGASNDYVYDPNYFFYDMLLPRQVYICDDITAPLASFYDATSLFRKVGAKFAPSTPSLAWADLEITNFDWHPIYWMCETGSETLRAVGDIQNLRFFDWTLASRIHENSILCLLQFQDHNFY